MRASFLLAAFASMLIGASVTHGGDGQKLPVAPKASGGGKQPTGKQLLFELCVYEGDPLGSLESGTIRVLSRPLTRTLENQSFLVGSQLDFTVEAAQSGWLLPDGTRSGPLGLIIRGTPGTIKDGKVPLDFTATYTDIGAQSADRVEVLTESTRTNMKVKLGEVVRIRLGKGTGNRQMWVELTAQELQNATRSPVPGVTPAGTLTPDLGLPNIPQSLVPGVTPAGTLTPDLGIPNIPQSLVPGVTPAGTLTPDLGIPIKSDSFDFSLPPFGGYPSTTPATGNTTISNEPMKLIFENARIEIPANVRPHIDTVKTNEGWRIRVKIPPMAEIVVSFLTVEAKSTRIEMKVTEGGLLSGKKSQ